MLGQLLVVYRALKDFTNIGNEFNNSEITAQYNKTVAEIFNHTHVEKNADIFKRFDESWVLVKTEIYTDWQTEPLLNLLGAERIMAAFKRWRVWDLYNFSVSIRSRYNISNLEHFFSAELGVIDQLIIRLHEWIEVLGIHRKQASLSEINAEFERIRDRMTANPEA